MYYRINLEYLQNPEEAVKIVRDVQSVEGAKMVARYVQMSKFSKTLATCHFRFYTFTNLNLAFMSKHLKPLIHVISINLGK